MIKNDHFETQNVIFERFWLFSKFNFSACSTIPISLKIFFFIYFVNFVKLVTKNVIIIITLACRPRYLGT